MKLSDFTRGWIVGDFFPCLVDTKDVEIGVIDLKAGDKGDGHWHERHVEINVIISGMAELNGILYKEGDIFTFMPLEKSNVKYLKDTKLLVVKSPSVKNDKFYDHSH